jgi:hypothetical protein
LLGSGERSVKIWLKQPAAALRLFEQNGCPFNTYGRARALHLENNTAIHPRGGRFLAFHQ